MFEIRRTEVFDSWLAALRDEAARALIAERISRLAFYEHFGDAKVVASGITELRVHYGAGYRLYLTRRGKQVVVLLCGGDKGSQRRDIARAIDLAALIKE
jgi:putative addiction module killer protein